jgi:hypothetical protein
LKEDIVDRRRLAATLGVTKAAPWRIGESMMEGRWQHKKSKRYDQRPRR